VWPPDRDAPATLSAQLDAVAGRLLIGQVLTALAAASAVGAIANLALLIGGSDPGRAALIAAAPGVVVFAAALIRSRTRCTAAEAARLLERHQPESRNVIVTAEELSRMPGRASAWIAARVFSDAARMAAAANVARVAPLTAPAAACAAAIGLWLGIAAGVPQRIATLARSAESDAANSTAAGERSIRVTATITPPAYLTAAPRTFRDPARLEAVAGSRLEIVVEGGDPAWTLRMGATPVAAAVDQGGILSASVTLTESTYLAVERIPGSQGSAAVRRLIPVVVAADRAPAIRIERPGKDLLLPDSSSSVPIGTAATDDFGVQALELRFTKVSGSGEQFEFEEGSIPLRLERESPRAWKGAATLALPELDLAPGDALVYRVVGHDARGPEAGGASSETFFVEIAAPGQPTLAGFELPPDRERYALSQQMIVLKIQRLLSREQSMPRESVKQEAEEIAAEQRAVRANFIFLTGGHVEDEEEEAAHSHEIQEGRLENSARREITAAIGHMSRTEQALVVPDPAAALPPARAAVEALQRAFGRNRYLLRPLAVRSRIDPSRRLTGELEGAVDSNRLAAEPGLDPVGSAARRLMAELLALAPALESEERRSAATDRLAAMAEQALAVDAASPAWQQISTALLQARAAAAEGRGASDGRSRIQDVFTRLRSEALRTAVPAGDPLPRHGRLRSAWAEERRK
jgi:hypothetical protein